MTKSNSYPQLPSTVWWTLRERFVQTVPKQVSINYLVSVLGVEEPAARQYLRYLRDLGLVDEKDATTALANGWRDDSKYVEVCRTILERCYPEDLRNVAPPEKPDRTEVVRWLMHTAGLGKGTADNKAAMYMLLCEADLSRREKKRARKEGAQKPTSTSRRQKAPKTGTDAAERRKSRSLELDRNGEDRESRTNTAIINPSLQLNVEIHLAPEMSAEQIDQVFGSMAKHLGIGSS